jgi:conjugal transfer ATP-binding protein TraC
VLEVMPQSGADERMSEVLVSLYANCPAGLRPPVSPLRLAAHPRTSCASYTNLRVEDDDQLETRARLGPARCRTRTCFASWRASACKHLLRGTRASITSGFHYTLRDFRLMLSVTLSPATPRT